MDLFLGIDLAWREGDAAATEPTGDDEANETGVVALRPDGSIPFAGWVRGVAATTSWLEHASALAHSVLAFADAALVIKNAEGQRLCETETGRRYGRWKVSANSNNLSSPRRGGLLLRTRLEALGWRYDDGVNGPPRDGRVVSECYPYTTIVGVPELGYELERPIYKRAPKKKGKAMRKADFGPLRARECDELLRRLAALKTADPPLLLESNAATKALLGEPSPLDDDAYKHREDILDAIVCAWTAAYWSRWGPTKCQVLGATDPLVDGRRGTIIAPA